ncbi:MULTISPECIES: LysR family transcriptional regulator [unclassified Beijerinckia]|uniref:LysR family transcriptional regulator n=1 Tax=unclassified Beijerinckia TaxID=2638183 RepID=UPI000897826F|nr:MULTISPECIES: LysR family transcriptional regulator [unclassified Beijerinckia]MDH7795820.1 DNA-binding transcriptional LysR family regulator [Beijerinckia sp. GAS462]SEC17777.1 transcriptional regulator, LysR family [Beijerinckia sp. 28-YEA-48]
MDESNISLRHLRVLALLLEVRSLTRAAQILDTTQPTVSKALTKLRAHFGDPLFVRVGLAMHPTPRALDLAKPLKDLLTTSDVMRASSAAFDPQASSREFSMIVTEVGMAQLVPPIIAYLEKQGLGLRLKAMPLDSRPIEARLEAGEADVVVGVFPGATANMRRQRLYTDTYMSVVRRTHPRVGKLVRPEAFLRERHVIVTSSPTGHGAHQALERVFAAKLDPDRVHVRVPSFVTSAMVVSKTDAVGTLPARLAMYLADDLKLMPFATPLPLPRIEISQFWHERVQQDAGHRWFRSTLRTLFGTSDGSKGKG